MGLNLTLPTALPTALPSGRPGQMLALALTALVMLALWAALAQPSIGWYRDRAVRTAEQRLLLARMTGIAAELPALRRAAQAASHLAQASRIPIAGGK